MKIYEYLRKEKEIMPKWLENYQIGDKIKCEDLFSGRFLYYPGSYDDGQPLKNVNLGHYCHVHFYVDYLLRFATDKEKTNMYYNNIFELYPKFIELVILDYLKMIGFNNRDLNIYKKDFDDSILEGIQGFDYFINEDMKDVNNQRLFHNIENYLYSEILAIYYHIEYLDNKEETKNNLYNLLIDNKYYNKDYIINNYGISFNELNHKRILNKYLYRRI